MEQILIDKLEINQLITSPIFTHDRISSPKIVKNTINKISSESNRKLPKITNFQFPKNGYYLSIVNSPNEIKSGFISPSNQDIFATFQEENPIQNKLNHKNPKVSRNLPAVFLPRTPLSNKNSQ